MEKFVKIQILNLSEAKQNQTSEAKFQGVAKRSELNDLVVIYIYYSIWIVF